MRKTAILTTILWIAAIPTSARGQAWVQEFGSYFFKVSANYGDTDLEFGPNGDEQPLLTTDSTQVDARFRDISLAAYLEYGLTPEITVVGTLPFKLSTTRATRISNGPTRRRDLTNGGLSDLSLGLRVKLLQRPLAIAVQGGIKVPLGYEEIPDNEGPSIGTGQFDTEAAIYVGQSLYPLPVYVQAGAGYRLRGGDFSDEAFFGIEAGFTAKRLFAKMRVDVVENAGSAAASSNESIAVRDQDWVKLSPGITFRITDRVAASADAFHVLSGNNTLAGTTWSVGMVFTP